MRLAHRVKELDELPHNLHAMPSIKKVKNWYAQSFEVSRSRDPLFPSDPVSALSFRIPNHVICQELITFPPIVVPPNIRQALMMSRPDDIALPESKPNPNDPYTHTNNLGNGGPHHGNAGNGFNKLKLRVPMERRCVHPISYFFFFFFFLVLMLMMMNKILCEYQQCSVAA